MSGFLFAFFASRCVVTCRAPESPYPSSAVRLPFGLARLPFRLGTATLSPRYGYPLASLRLPSCRASFGHWHGGAGTRDALLRNLLVVRTHLVI